MKPFNLDLAKAGHPVCTVDGRKARIVCFDRKIADYPLVVLIETRNGVEETICTYTEEGKFHNKPFLDNGMCDLRMLDNIENSSTGTKRLAVKVVNPETGLLGFMGFVEGSDGIKNSKGRWEDSILVYFPNVEMLVSLKLGDVEPVGYKEIQSQYQSLFIKKKKWKIVREMRRKQGNLLSLKNSLEKD